MGRMYAVAFVGTEVTNAQDLFEVIAASGKAVVLHGLVISQESDATDANDAMLPIEVVRMTATVTSGTGGSTPTPVPLAPSDTAFAGTVDTLNTSGASTDGGSYRVLADAFNVRSGYQLWWPPEARPQCVGAQAFVVRLPETPVSAITMSATIYFEEIG